VKWEDQMCERGLGRAMKTNSMKTKTHMKAVEDYDVDET